MTSIIFPGQGSQFVEMSKDFYDNFSISRDVFEKISNVSDIDIKEIIFKNPNNLINQTKYTQLSIFCASIAIFQALEKEIGLKTLNIKSFLGHSLGEYTSLVAANIINIEDCVVLLKNRGNLMQNAYEPNKSGMAAIIGKNCNDIENIINHNNLEVEVANDNSPMQIVVSGIKGKLIESEKYFKESGAKKFILLNVSAAFHSKLMIDAEKKLLEFIKETSFKESPTSIISNYTGKITNISEVIVSNLSKQMSNRVRWVESIKTLENSKEKKIIEIGPGKVLSGLIKRISNQFTIYNVEKISDLEKIKNGF